MTLLFLNPSQTVAFSSPTPDTTGHGDGTGSFCSLLLPTYPLLLPIENTSSDHGIGNLGTSACSYPLYSPLHSPSSCKNLVPVLLSVSATLLLLQYLVILIPVQMMPPGSWPLSMLAKLKDSIIFFLLS